MTSRIFWTRESIHCKQGLISIMVGRKRKSLVQREANGRAARVYENPRAQVASQPHRMQVPEQFREWEEAESEFGRLMLNGLITPAQHEAGVAYNRVVGRMRALINSAPSPHPKSIDPLRTARGIGGEISSERVKQIRCDHNDAFIALRAAGMPAVKAVNAHAIYDRWVHEWPVLTKLRLGLDKLVVHFGINPAKELARKTHRIPQPVA